MRLVGLFILLGPTILALQDALRRPVNAFPVGNRMIWSAVLIIFGLMGYLVLALASFVFIAPFVYLLMVVLRHRQERQGRERP